MFYAILAVFQTYHGFIVKHKINVHLPYRNRLAFQDTQQAKDPVRTIARAGLRYAPTNKRILKNYPSSKAFL